MALVGVSPLEESNISISYLQSFWSDLSECDHSSARTSFVLEQQWRLHKMKNVQTYEVVELDHASTAHHVLDEAVNEEKVLENVAKERHHNAEDADAILDTYQHDHLQEDTEERREMAISDIAHHVENYVETRLRAAKEKEVHAKEEEDRPLWTRLANLLATFVLQHWK